MLTLAPSLISEEDTRRSLHVPSHVFLSWAVRFKVFFVKLPMTSSAYSEIYFLRKYLLKRNERTVYNPAAALSISRYQAIRPRGTIMDSDFS